MAATTTNLHLKLLGTTSDDKAVLFEDWRQDINGEGSTSNMQIIDAAYGQLADAVQAITNEQIDALFS